MRNIVVQVDLASDEQRLVLQGTDALTLRIKEIPGARFSKALGAWTLPVAWSAVLALGTEVREVGGQVLPSHEVADIVLSMKESYGWLAQQSEQRPSRTGPWGRSLGLFAHQEVGARWLAASGTGGASAGRLLLDEMGTGKSRTVLAAAMQMEHEGVSPWPMLVVCPATVKASWAAEIQEFFGSKAPVTSVVGGTAAQRRKAIARVSSGSAQICIVGWEALRLHARLRAFPGQTLRACPACGGSRTDVVPESRCQRHARELDAIEWSVQVADEVHRAKNPTTQQTQALWGVGESCASGRRWALSGTLVANSPEDMWPVLHWVDPDGFPVKSKWVSRYCVETWNWAGFREVSGLRPERRAELDRWFRPVRRRVLKAEALDLPEVQRGGTLVRWLDMGKEQQAAYKQMRDEMIAWLEDGRLTAANALVQVGRLMLLASAYGTVVKAPPTPDSKPGVGDKLLPRLPSNKVTAFLEDLSSGDYGNSQLVVAMHSRGLLRLLEQEMAADARWKADGIVCIAGDVSERDRAEGIKSFQEGRARFVLMTYGAGGVGITLTAADTMVLLQRSWSAIEMRQTIDRIHRIGSERHESISVIDYVSTGTVETEQIARVVDKEQVLEEIVRDQDTLRQLLLGHTKDG